MADGSRQTGGLFLLRNGVGTLRVAADLRSTGSDFDAGYTRGFSSSSSETVARSSEQEVCRLRRHPILVDELDMPTFCRD